MKRTAIVYSPRYLVHDTGPSHPESPRRLKVIMEEINRGQLLRHEECSLVKPRYASLKELELVHNPEYISFVRKLSESGGGILDEETETIASPGSFRTAQLAAGGALKAVEQVMNGNFRNAFVLARPPGHHADSSHAFGFCIFNNVALAAQHLRKRFGLNRILILDLDSHHGNGTQEIFYDTNEVLYVSLHEDPSEFPQTGFIDEIGEKQGLGFTVNIPFPFRTGDPSYWKAVKTIVVPIARQYKPEFILISAGFDGYYRDIIGELSLSAQIFLRVFQAFLNLADYACEGRMVATLEGGYCLRFLRKIVPAIIRQMAGLNIKVHGKRPILDPSTERKAEKVIEKVRKIQSGFWEL